MMRAVAVLLFAAGVLLPTRGHGQTSCLPDYTAAQAIWSANAPTFKQSLLSRRSGNLITTRVWIEGTRTKDSADLWLRFDPDFDGVSLPYNLFAVLIIRDGEPAAWWDFTASCKGPGLSFFPGREVHLPPLKLIGGPSDRLQIMVWGRL